MWLSDIRGCIYSERYNVTQWHQGIYLFREIQCDSVTSGDLSIQGDTRWLSDIRGFIYSERYNVTQWHQGVYLFREIQCDSVTSGDVSIQRGTMWLSDIRGFIYSERYNVTQWHQGFIYSERYNVRQWHQGICRFRDIQRYTVWQFYVALRSYLTRVGMTSVKSVSIWRLLSRHLVIVQLMLIWPVMRRASYFNGWWQMNISDWHPKHGK